jgi:2',3'-cyclic-nucleotide 2'-phosphodiesterase (5'-nucleotidase family)
MKAKGGKLTEVKVDGKPVNPKSLYTVATSDYLSGGTDHMEALTHYVNYWNSDLLIRELYMDAVREQDTIRAAVDGRMDIQP